MHLTLRGDAAHPVIGVVTFRTLSANILHFHSEEKSINIQQFVEKTLPAKSRLFMSTRSELDEIPRFIRREKSCCDVAFSGCFVTHKLCDTLLMPAAIMGFFRF